MEFIKTPKDRQQQQQTNTNLHHHHSSQASTSPPSPTATTTTTSRLLPASSLITLETSVSVGGGGAGVAAHRRKEPPDDYVASATATATSAGANCRDGQGGQIDWHVQSGRVQIGHAQTGRGQVSSKCPSPVSASDEIRRLLSTLQTTISKEMGVLSREVGGFLQEVSRAGGERTAEEEAAGVVKKVDNVKYVDRFTNQKPTGTLYLTTTHLIFVDAEGRRETWILHTHIGAVDKLPMSAEGCPLVVRCKNFLCVTFIIPRERDCHDIFQSVQEFSRPAEIDKLYAFTFTSPECPDKTYGWDMFDIRSEYLRMGAPNQEWENTKLNENYDLCDTYPSLLYVPATLLQQTHVLLGSSKFRSRGRLPVLSYLCRENQASLTRCSQPLSGFSARCLEDENMLQAILSTNPKSDFMYVVDTRPKINAMVNKAQGKGYENENNYSNMRFKFLGIENIHVMRASLQKLTEVCELKRPTMNDFLSRLESSSWLKHIASVIETSTFIAKAIHEGTSVLVHCSDGWDRTAQVCSLAGLMLDPHYRTLQGFQALIEKEWLSFGHKFMDRCGLLESVEPREVSPVFTQFLESVWQMSQLWPCAFQFNERFLLTIHDHAYSCQFGTFIGNCEKDRVDLRLSDRTYSLWGFLNQHSSEFLNPLYRKEYEIRPPLIPSGSAPQALKFWRGMYNRYENGVHPRESILDIVSAAKDHTASLEDHIMLLEKRVTQICRMLGKSDETIQRKLQGHLSMESIDGILINHVGDGGVRTPSLKSSPIEDDLASLSMGGGGGGGGQRAGDVAGSGVATSNGRSWSQTSNSSTATPCATSTAITATNSANNTNTTTTTTTTATTATSSSSSVAAATTTNNHLKSDSESGFDESSSQMSRSGIEDYNYYHYRSSTPDSSGGGGGGGGSGVLLSPSADQLSLDQLILELKSVAVKWRSFRNVQTCSCATPFDFYSKKFHCWRCGSVFCQRCIARSVPLPGHYHRRPVPVCKPCYKQVKRSPSLELPPASVSTANTTSS